MTSTARTPVPPLIIAMSLDRPGVNPGRNALVALSSIAQRGYPTGDVVTDLGYSQQKVENYHNPTRTLGYEPIMMYKRKDLGVQGTYNGILLIEGTLYGPCIPQPLIDASIDYANKVIDSATYTARLEQRRAYAARRKEHTPGKATYVVVCPAYGPNATATCPPEAPEAQQRRSRPPQSSHPHRQPTPAPAENLYQHHIGVSPRLLRRQVPPTPAVPDTGVANRLRAPTQRDGRQKSVHKRRAI